MVVEFNDVIKRWNNIRANGDCALDLAPDTVAKFISKKESSLVKDRIRESLEHLANFRLDNMKFASDSPDATGPIVICEGLESFLVPAVERVLPFSDFLRSYEKSQDISTALANDVEQLIGIWKRQGFSGEPYAKTNKIKTSIKANLAERFDRVQITESGAIACRVIMHLLTLCLNRPKEEAGFYDKIGKRLDKYTEELIEALEKAIGFLVDAFQKGPDDENPIGSATYGGMEGSGWSWTNWHGLPPMLFFTSAAVDAFAELDLYLIRPYKDGKLERRLREFYEKNEKSILEYEFCVDMARRWILKSIINEMCRGYGLYYEPDVELNKKPSGSEGYQEDLKRVEAITTRDRELLNPLALYNNLYALLTLLWTFSDWDDPATNPDRKTKSKIERSLLQLVSNYRSIPVFREMLNRFPLEFYLPGEAIFDKSALKEDRSYMDSGFLTLLTRQLVLFGVYGIGDRNVLDPLIRELYVDLLLSRYGKDPKYAYLWSARSREIFSTQRAIQALTFYCSYIEGREASEEKMRQNQNIDLLSLFSNLVEKLKSADSKRKDEVSAFLENVTFQRYCEDKGFPWRDLQSPQQTKFRMDVSQIGNSIIRAIREREIEYEVGVSLLERCAEIAGEPVDSNGNRRTADLETIKVKLSNMNKSE